MSQVRKTSTDIENATLKAVRHLAQTGDSFSLADILRYLSSKQLLNMADSETIVQLNLNKDVDKGLLKKLTNGKYKVNETARRVVQTQKKDLLGFCPLNVGPDPRSALEVADVGVPAVPEDANVRAAEKDASVLVAEKDASVPAVAKDASVPAAEEDASVPAAEEDASVPAAEEDASVPAAEEDASVPAAEEDASVPAAEEDASVPLPGDDNQNDVHKLLKKLTNGKYKVNETARRRKSRRTNSKEGPVRLLHLKCRSRSKNRSGSSRRRRSSSARRRKRSSSGRRRKRSSSGKRRTRSSSGRRRKRSSSGRRRKRSSSGRRRKRSSSGRRRKRSPSRRRQSKRRTKTPEEQE